MNRSQTKDSGKLILRGNGWERCQNKESDKSLTKDWWSEREVNGKSKKKER